MSEVAWLYLEQGHADEIPRVQVRQNVENGVVLENGIPRFFAFAWSMGLVSALCENVLEGNCLLFLLLEGEIYIEEVNDCDCGSVDEYVLGHIENILFCGHSALSLCLRRCLCPDILSFCPFSAFCLACCIRSARLLNGRRT
jgi:hypothetical protein